MYFHERDPWVVSHIRRIDKDTPLECSSHVRFPTRVQERRHKRHSGHSKRAATGNGTTALGKLLNPFVLQKPAPTLLARSAKTLSETQHQVWN
jgi:hypothetical protein